MTGFAGIFEDHLNLDTVVAYVDGELSLTAFQRAAAHVTRCPGCAAEVAEQSTVRSVLRSADAPRMPTSLADALFSIPVAMPVAARSPGVGMDLQTGHAIRVSHLGRDVTRSRRFRLGAGALVAGIAVGAFASAGTGSAEDPVPAPSVAVDPQTTTPSVPYPGSPALLKAPGVPSPSSTR